MKSDGGLTPVDDFGGHQAVLSEPTGSDWICKDCLQLHFQYYLDVQLILLVVADDEEY